MFRALALPNGRCAANGKFTVPCRSRVESIVTVVMIVLPMMMMVIVIEISMVWLSLVLMLLVLL